MKRKSMQSLARILFFIAFCWAGTVLGLSHPPPFDVTFNDGEIPTDLFALNSNGDGRIALAADTTALQTNQVPSGFWMFGDDQESTGVNRVKGNFYSCDTPMVLNSHSITLDRTNILNVTFMVYESSTSDGTYSAVHSNSVSASVGTGAISSGSMNVLFEAGKFYLVAAGWDASATYTYLVPNYHPRTVTFGESIGGYSKSGSLLGSVSGSNTTEYLYFQSLEFSTNMVVRMDSALDSSYSTNQLTLKANLAGYTDVTLDFRHRESGDEAHPADGIFIATNTIQAPVKIYDLDVGDRNWHSVSLDIDALASAQGITLGVLTLITFQQADDYEWAVDGREFDDIQLYSKPDMQAYSLKSEGSSSISKIWKGFDSAKTFPVDFTVKNRGGSSDWSHFSINTTYRFKDSGGVTRRYQGESGAWSIPAMQVTTNVESTTFSILSTTKLTDVNYTLYADADDADELTEALESNNEQTLSMTVNHYSGNLWFDNVVTDITITNWGVRITDSKTEHWIDGSGTLSNKTFQFTHLDVVKDLNTLDYEMTATNTATFDLSFPLRYEVNGVDYWRLNLLELSVDGAYCDIRVLFPAGLGVSSNSMTLMESGWTFDNVKLNQGLYPNSPLSVSADLFVAEETKPLVYYTDEMIWYPSAAVFQFSPHALPDARFVRGNQLDSLEANAGLLESGSMVEKKSNSQYYRGVRNVTSGVIYVYVGAKKDAQLTVTVDVTPVEMVTHFPYGVTQEWGVGSTLRVDHDLVRTELSELKDPVDSEISYARNCDCPDVNCRGWVIKASVPFAPEGNSLVSMDGGVRTSITNLTSENLQWGTRSDDTNFSQQVENFTHGTLYIPGHFVRGDLSGFDATQQFGPAEILLSGMATNSTPAMERPSDSSSYSEGLADYAGLNFRVATDGGDRAHSILGGTNSGWWGLTDRSKYYIRRSGVTGIHEAKPGEFPSELEIYKYQFTFSQYGLSYLSGKPKESRTDGTVVVPEPCDITMAFEELMFDCMGELEDADLANSESRTLSYWAAVIQPLSLFFAPTGNDECGNSERALCMGLTTHCANVDQTLSGVLGFMSHGGLGNPDDEIEGVPSRLAAPNQIELDGPGSEVYYFNPVAMPYYNDYIASGDSSTNRGWINFAGNLDVSFFSDLPVQFHTSANTNSSLAPIYMTGGWGDGSGKTFFNAVDLASFDAVNAGFPSGETDYAAYRKPDVSSETYRTRAQRSWLNVVNLDYPLEWSSSTKSFKSPKTQTVDLMVLNAEHQTDYLSADNAEISFGMQYDGLPQINLANMAFNAIDEATGMASAFGDAVGDVVRDTIDQGAEAMDDTLSDLPEQLFDPIFEQVLDPLIDNFYTNLYEAYTNAPDTDYYSATIAQYIHGVGAAPYEDVEYILKNLTDSANTATNLIGEVSSRLDEAVSMIDAFIAVVPDGSGGELPGVLFKSSGEYDTLAGLGGEILKVLANTLYSSVSESINDELSAALEEAAPSLEAITEVLTELRVVVTNVQGQLDVAGSFMTELESTLNTTALDNPLLEISTGIEAYLESLPAGGASFDEYSPEEMKGMIRQKITDEFYASMPCADVQQIIRTRLYDVDAAIQEAIDSAFQQLNKAMRDLVSEYMAGIDDEINGMLGKLSAIMGSGEIDGYAHIRGDSLTELRVDGKFQWEVPDEMSFNAYLIIKQLDSSSAGGCGAMGEVLPEVTLGTKAFGIGWLGAEIKADIETKFTFMMDGDDLDLIGLAGSFEMVEGQLGFESFAITELYAGVAFGERENYLSANVRCTFTSYEVEGGVFFGKTCSLDPFSWDPDVQAILGEPPFTGVYVYGEGWMPIVDYGCMFRIKAGVGAGIFAFVDGPIGGKIFMGADGEALCVVNVSGEVTLVGLKDGDDMRMSGKGKISGRAGSCPFCVKFSKTVTIDYDNGSWDVDY